MALIKCNECGHDVSTEATACPQCGAKPKRKSRAIPLFAVLVGLIALVVIAGRLVPSTKSHAATQRAETSPANIEPPPAPSHYFAWSERGQFGYEKELSHDAKMRGEATGALFIITPRSAVAGGHEFISIDNGVATVFSCVEPCDVMKTYGSLGPHVIPAPVGSVLWAVIEDSRHGQLTERSVSPEVGNAHRANTMATTSVVEVAVDPAPTAIPVADLYREYLTNPMVADAKYEGRRVNVTGLVIAANFNDAGLGHLRMVVTDGGRNGTNDTVFLCFTESCESMRRPTVSDDQFKMIKVGSVINSTCTVEPVKFARATPPEMVSVSLSKCSMP